MRLIVGGDSDIAKNIKGKHLSREECDVTKIKSFYHWIEEVKPDEVVYCAGAIHPSTIKDSDLLNWFNEFRVNLNGAYYLAKLADPQTKIVFVASTSGLRGRAGWGGYCASKAGLISLVQTLAEEGRQVWCVSPGRTATKMRKALFPKEQRSGLLKAKNVATVVEDCLQGKYEVGSNVIVRCDGITIC